MGSKKVLSVDGLLPYIKTVGLQLHNDVYSPVCSLRPSTFFFHITYLSSPYPTPDPRQYHPHLSRQSSHLPYCNLFSGSLCCSSGFSSTDPPDHVMSSSLTHKRGCAHPVIDPDDHPESSLCLQNCDCCRVSLRDFVSSETSNVSLGPTIPSMHRHSKDDIAISSGPLRQVDYLSHNWEEEDIRSSWRYIVIGRGTLLDDVRLENAAWRTWAKVKNSLKTIPPEALNWFVSPILINMFNKKAYTSKAKGA